jgi:hypothetical protein
MIEVGEFLLPTVYRLLNTVYHLLSTVYLYCRLEALDAAGSANAT